MYLRKIFENLIFQTFENQQDKIGITAENFKLLRMLDKVEALKIYLPSQLLEMKELYGILSKGVHELTEEECLSYFSPIKLSIELILDQKVEKRLKQDRDLLVKQELKKIHQTLSS